MVVARQRDGIGYQPAVQGLHLRVDEILVHMRCINGCPRRESHPMLGGQYLAHAPVQPLHGEFTGLQRLFDALPGLAQAGRKHQHVVSGKQCPQLQLAGLHGLAGTLHVEGVGEYQSAECQFPEQDGLQHVGR